MKSIVKFNISVAFLYCLAFLLGSSNFPYLIYAIGLLAFFIPALNFTLMVEQITQIRQGRAKLALWTLIFSLTVTPTVIYLFSDPINKKNLLLAFGILWLVSLAGSAITYFWKKTQSTHLSLPPVRKYPLLWISVLTFLGIITIHFSLYPFIPEADGYGYLIKLKTLSQGLNSNLNLSQARSLFLILSQSLTSISQIPVYWLYKIIMPLLGVSFILAFYQLSQKITHQWFKLLSSLSLLLFPVIVLELLITRPQSIFLITLPISLYLISELYQNSKKNLLGSIYWFLLLLLISILGIKMHEFFIFAVFFALLGLLASLWSKIKKNPLESSLIFLAILAGVYPWLRDVGAINLLIHFLSPFIYTILHPRFELWFIDNYINIDGAQMGWSGWSWLYYYGYNLGTVALLMIIYLLTKRVKFNLSNTLPYLKDKWIYFTSFLVFFSIAEIFPRIGLAYLPDRAWLFVAVSLAFFLPSLLASLATNPLSKKLIAIIMLTAFCSIAISWITTYAKQGWISRNEYEALQYIKNNTPSDAIIISQGGNNPGIKYLADRTIVIPNQKFLEKGTKESLKIEAGQAKQEELTQTKKIIKEEIAKNAQQLPDNGNEDKIIQQILNNIKALQETTLQIKTHSREIVQDVELKRNYFFYSKDKFNNLYNLRDWWKKFNFYGINLDNFSRNFPLVYHKKGIYLWEIE